ncbi:hypothetical protein PIB30_073658, partial [Stylosanthes scabra]|nr:hypothetical protein [Stylosanthes scabra]MED6187141.1 hypothetical protein [Stylosanthes scabra]
RRKTATARRRAWWEAPESEVAPSPSQLRVNGDDNFRLQWGDDDGFRLQWATEMADTVLGWG